MKLIRILHRWMALSTGLFVLLSALSGLFLLYKNDLIRWTLGVNASTAPTYDLSRIGAFLNEIFTDDIAYIDFPKEETPYFMLQGVSGAPEFYHPETLYMLPDKYGLSSVITFLVEYHTELLGGSLGGVMVGLLGATIFVLTLGGLILWVPVRRSFRLRHAIPRSINRGHILLSHRTFGVVAATFLMVISVTGSGMIFSSATQSFINIMLGEESVSLNHSQKIHRTDTRKVDWNAALKEFSSTIPNGSITRLYARENETPYLKLRFRLKKDWVPNGGSFAYINSNTNQVVHVVYLDQTDTGSRLVRNLYPIHAAYIGGAVYKFFVFCAGIGMIFMTITGYHSWFAAIPALADRKSKH